MFKIDPKFLADVQAAGWIIHGADAHSVIGKCPRAGCSLTTMLKAGVKIPETCRPGFDLASVRVVTFDDARVAFRDKRIALGLNIKEVEECAGAATDHFAKAEKDNPTRIPNAEIFIEWATALGFQVLLVPGDLPPYTRRVIVETRQQLRSRRVMQPHHAARRERIRGAGKDT